MLPKVDRRVLVRNLAAAGITPWLTPRARAADEPPHFLLVFLISGGADASYTFDARPLALTDAGKQSNYLYRNAAAGTPVLPDARPFLWRGRNDHATLATPLVRPLERFKDDLTVVNGVLMLANGLIGHDANLYYLFTGKSANATSFVPLVGQARPAPLDSIHFGGFEGCGNQMPTNFAGSIQLTAGIAGNLAADLVAQRPLAASDAVTRMITSRFAANSAGTGLFSAGNRKAKAGLDRAPELAVALHATGPSDDEDGEGLDATLALAARCLKAGVTRAMTIVLDHDFVPEHDFDTHDPEGAQTQLAGYRSVVAEIERCLDWLKTTPYDEAAGLTLFDVSTAVFATEFSRTMRVPGSPIDDTGTDHNPLTNTVLLAGKGIQGGLVVGGSDLASVDERGEFLAVSGAHRQMDAALISPMGLPFDFATGRPLAAQPEEFHVEQYLTFSSIVNTLLDQWPVEERLKFTINPGVVATAPRLPFLRRG